MVVIVAGSRSVTDINITLDAVVDSGFPVTEVISGCARNGPDRSVLMKPWACLVTKMPADWERHGRKIAGFIRNQAMIDYGAQALVAVWDGESNGTRDMITRARKARLPVFLVTTSP